MSYYFGEVVELVYGTSLENWRAFVAYRGFESHPLRQKIKGHIMLALLRLDEMFIASRAEKHEQFAGVVQWLESQSSKPAIRVRFSPLAPGDLPKW